MLFARQAKTLRLLAPYSSATAQPHAGKHAHIAQAIAQEAGSPFDVTATRLLILVLQLLLLARTFAVAVTHTNTHKTSEHRLRSVRRWNLLGA